MTDWDDPARGDDAMLAEIARLNGLIAELLAALNQVKHGAAYTAVLGDIINTAIKKAASAP